MSLFELGRLIEDTEITSTNVQKENSPIVISSETSTAMFNGSRTVRNASSSSSSSNSNSNNKQAQAAAASKIVEYLEINEDDLEMYERCGRGSYGSVFRGLWKSRNKIVAIKKLLQLEQNEAAVLSSCSHRNIIQFYGIVSKASNYCIVTGR